MYSDVDQISYSITNFMHNILYCLLRISEILGKYRQKKIPWITAEILDLCDERRELRKKRFKPKESEKYKEVNNNITRCMKKAKKTGHENSVVRVKLI